MTEFEWLMIGWNIALTLWLLIVKKGPRGIEGQVRYTRIDYQDIKYSIVEVVDDPEFMMKLIAKLNAFQLQRGSKVSVDPEAEDDE